VVTAVDAAKDVDLAGLRVAVRRAKIPVAAWSKIVTDLVPHPVVAPIAHHLLHHADAIRLRYRITDNEFHT